MNSKSIPRPSLLSKLNVGNLFRYLGSLSIALSGIVYLFQGFDSVDIQIRNWMYLILMGALAAGGVGARFMLHDAKGGRLFFVIAAAIIPIQFAQLGGMLFSLYEGSNNALSTLFYFGDTSIFSTGIYGFITLLLAIPISAFSFSILVRSKARIAALLFIVSNTILLLPFREGILGFLLIALLAIAHLYTEKNLSKNNIYFKTTEGKLARLISIIPFGISFFRIVFHIDSSQGYTILSGLAGLIIIAFSIIWFERSTKRDFYLLTGTITSVISWITFIALSNLPTFTQYGIATAFYSSALFITAINLLSSKNIKIYRILILICTGLSVGNLLLIGGGINTLLALTMSLSLVAWGVYQKRKHTLIEGGILSGLCTLYILFESIQSIEVNVWISLAIAGFILLVLSSFYERFGKSFVKAASHYWNESEQWQ